MPECNRTAYSRGLCSQCVRIAAENIRRGNCTEAELIKKGLLLPAKKRGPKPKTAFAKALAAKSK